jgi:hypothetical protein
MANSYGEILTARGGSYILNNASAYNQQFFYAVVVLENTVIKALYTEDRNGTVNDLALDDHIADPTIAVKAGAIITPMDFNAPFSRIELLSGSVALILK